MSIRSIIFWIFIISCMTFIANAQTMVQDKSTVNVGANPSYIVCGDLNDDGWLDLVTADRGELSDPREERPANDEISILIHSGISDKQKEVSFTKLQPSLKTGFAPYGITLANIDALKWPDIVVVNFMAVRNEDLSLFRNLQQEGIYETHDFKVPDDSIEYMRQSDGEDKPLFTKPGLSAVAVRDMDGDGLRDAVATAWSSDALILFSGNAETYFNAPILYPLPGAPRDLQIQDFNADGIPDMAVILYNTNEVSLWLGNKEGDWRESSRFSTRGRLPVRLQSADLNDDKRPDLIVTHAHTDDSVVIFYNDETCQFSVSQEILLGKNREVLEHEPRDCTVGDFNGDGRTDLAVTCFASSQVKVILNLKKEEAPLPHFKIEDYPYTETPPRALCAGDFNKDGKDDIAVSLWNKNAVGFLYAR